jgi:outer membrane protein assembly factor BamB
MQELSHRQLKSLNCYIMKTKTIAIFLLAMLSYSVKAQKISEWRPENRTGISSETGLLKSWPANGPKMLWPNLDLLKGFSSPSFGASTIYITGTKGNIGSNEILFALDMNGKTLWQTEFGRSWTGSNPESRATPTIEGDRVYTCSGFGDLACIDGTTGKIIWTYKASELNKGTYGSWHCRIIAD